MLLTAGIHQYRRKIVMWWKDSEWAAETTTKAWYKKQQRLQNEKDYQILKWESGRALPNKRNSVGKTCGNEKWEGSEIKQSIVNVRQRRCGYKEK